MIVIRLQRRGKRNQPFFWIVVAEKTAPIKGKFIEKLGFWNPIKKQKGINNERVKYWISKGAKASESVHNLLVGDKIIEGEKRKIKITKKKTKEESKEEPKNKEKDKKITEEKKDIEKPELEKEVKEKPKEEKKEEKKDQPEKKEETKKNKKEDKK